MHRVLLLARVRLRMRLASRVNRVRRHVCRAYVHRYKYQYLFDVVANLPRTDIYRHVLHFSFSAVELSASFVPRRNPEDSMYLGIYLISNFQRVIQVDLMRRSDMATNYGK